jgi:hypothetical protein
MSATSFFPVYDNPIKTTLKGSQSSGTIYILIFLKREIIYYKLKFVNKTKHTSLNC